MYCIIITTTSLRHMQIPMIVISIRNLDYEITGEMLRNTHYLSFQEEGRKDKQIILMHELLSAHNS